MKKDLQDRIDEFILDRMSEEEKYQFEAEINQDEAKREQLVFTENVKSAITSREDKLAKLKVMKGMYNREYHVIATLMPASGTDDCQYASASQYAEKKPPKRIWWWTSGVAVALVIGIFVVNPFGSGTLQTPTGCPDEMMRGEENDVFDMETPILNDSIKSDSIPPRDIVIVEKDRMDVSKE